MTTDKPTKETCHLIRHLRALSVQAHEVAYAKRKKSYPEDCPGCNAIRASLLKLEQLRADYANVVKKNDELEAAKEIQADVIYSAEDEVKQLRAKVLGLAIERDQYSRQAKETLDKLHAIEGWKAGIKKRAEEIESMPVESHRELVEKMDAKDDLIRDIRDGKGE